MTARLALCALLPAWLCGVVTLRADSENQRAHAAHVVLIVWDGMRPDFVTQEHAPTLWQLAREGVTFRKHHSVYPTLTSVNATALATGVFPNRSGPLGNYEYLPEINRTKTARMDDDMTMRAGDKRTNGKYLAVPTITELVQQRGGRTAVAGTKSAPLLFDRNADARASANVVVFEGATLPKTARAEIEKAIGPYPAREEVPTVKQDRWTTRALTEALWKDGAPEFSVIWMGEPDRSEHAAAPGSATALTAIKSADDNLAVLLRALEKKGVREQTDLLIVSDHGFSTIGRPIDLEGLLAKNNLPVVKLADAGKREGAIRVVGNGGTAFFYVSNHDAELIARLVRWLQTTDFAGVIFSRTKLEGTFPLSRVHLEKPGGPDVVMSFRWSDRRNEHGVAGMIETNGSSQAKGTHGTLSPFDVHNICIATGPDFRKGVQSDLPSSNLDVAASIVHLLGLTPPHPLDGRVLTEAFHHGDAFTSETMEEARVGSWRQYLRVSKVGATEYIDEGNGDAESD